MIQRLVMQDALSKVAALGLLGGVLWLSASMVVLPLHTRLTEAREALQQERSLLGALLDEARSLGSRPAGQGPDQAANVFLPGDSDAAIVAGLQARIEQVAADTNVRLFSLQPTGEQVQGTLRTFAIRVAGQGTLESLQAFLHALEAGEPALLISSLDIGSTEREAEPNAELDMRISITGAVPLARTTP